MLVHPWVLPDTFSHISTELANTIIMHNVGEHRHWDFANGVEGQPEVWPIIITCLLPFGHVEHVTDTH